MPARRSPAASLAVAALVVLGFATPLRALWAQDGGPWWLPFAAWSLPVAALAWLGRVRR